MTEITDDGESCDVASIAAGLIEYDDYDDANYLHLHTSTNTGKPDTYNEFINKMILPISTDMIKAIQQFITKFYADFQVARGNAMSATATNNSSSSSSSDAEYEESQSWSSRVWTFLDHVFETMKASPVWSHESDAQFEASKTHCEKFLYIKLYPVLFASDLEDVVLNERTHERIDSLGFLTAEHLDIKCSASLYEMYLTKHRKALPADNSNNSNHAQQPQPQLNSSSNGHHSNALPAASVKLDFLQLQDHSFLDELLQQPMQYLSELGGARCPQDKLLCVKRCTMAIAQLLKGCRTDGSLPGADELLPMMIYAIKTCNPPHLHSNLKYLQRYTRPAQLIAEAGYLLTNFVSAVFFLDNVDAKALTIEPEEFDRAILQSRMRAKAANDKALSLQQRQLLLHSQSNRKNKNTKKNASLNARQTSGGLGGTAVQENGVHEEDDDDDVDLDSLLANYKKTVHLNNKLDAVSVRDVHSRRFQCNSRKNK